MPSAILDWTGRPMASFAGAGSGNLYARSPDDNRLRPTPRNHFDDYVALLGSWNWRSLVSEARGVSTRGLIAGALLQKAEYLGASDWRTYYPGEDSDYGDKVEQLLEDTSHLCCTRGPRYDWDTFWTLMFLAAEVDGGAFILLTGNADGWPLIQPFEAHRIGQRANSAGAVKAGSATTTVTADDGTTSVITTPYVDLKIDNGIIYNRAGAEVAFRVLGATEAEDQDVSARDMIHVAPPRWFSEGRPLGKIVPGLMDIIAVGLARDSQLSQQIIDSKLTAIVRNATGKQDITRQLLNQGPGNQTANGTNAELVETAQFRYLKTGEDAQPWSTQRPSDQWMNYDERMAASAINPFWRIEMLDPTALRGAATRAFQDQINTKIRSSFKPFRLPIQRVRRYQISKFTKIGMLPDHVDFLKCGVTQPPDFVVDRNSAIVDIAMVRAGADNMPNVLRRSGIRPEENLNAQARWLYQRHKFAQKWSRDGLKIQPDELGNLKQRGDNDPIDKLVSAVGGGVIAPGTDVNDIARGMLDLPPAPAGTPTPDVPGTSKIAATKPAPAAPENAPTNSP
ncbi:MAG TPA: hypothetical protein DEQ40_02090 [Oxalobacteraceae bacterium]|jgi:hypothetical protein|nr:hypothetical protein [Oxalobacteraceae bacterium]